MNRKMIIIIFVLILLGNVNIAQGLEQGIQCYIEKISFKIDNNTDDIEYDVLFYDDLPYMSLEQIESIYNSDIDFHDIDKEVDIKRYRDFDECNPLEGEIFVYGTIKILDDEKGYIEIEQAFDHNSTEIEGRKEIVDDLVIILKRGDNKMNIAFKDLKLGDNIGMVLNAKGKVRGIILEG